MKCQIRIDMDNSAFGDTAGVELSRILTQIAAEHYDLGRDCIEEKTLRDYNGNIVGKLEIT
jgi:hypothetical protein